MRTASAMNACIGHRSGPGINGFLSDAWDTITSPFVDGATWVSHLPGFEQAGDALGDFAKTAVGKIVLRAISDSFFGPLQAVVGPQLASIVWAVPGLMAGDDFDHAWLTEFKSRCDQVAEVSGIPGVENLTGELSVATQAIASQFDIGETCTWALSELAQIAGVSDYAAAASRSLWNRTDPPDPAHYDPVSGRYLPFAAGDAQKVLWLTNADMRVDTGAATRAKLSAADNRFILPPTPEPDPITAKPAPGRTVRGTAPSSHGIPPVAIAAGALGLVAIGAIVLTGKKKGRRR